MGIGGKYKVIDNGYGAFYAVFENVLILGNSGGCMIKYTKKAQI